MGAGVSNATGLGGLTNGDVVREGRQQSAEESSTSRAAICASCCRSGPQLAKIDAAQDQIAGTEAARGSSSRSAGSP